MTHVIEQTGATIKEESHVEVPSRTGEGTREIEVRAEADLLKEYVGAIDTGYHPWTDNRYIRALPNPIDELQRDFGTSLYDVDMPADPQIYSTLSILVMAILAQGTRLTPAVDKGAPRYDEAVKANEFCLYNHRNLRRPLAEVQYELVEGMLKMGHKVGELIYEQRTTEPGSKLIRMVMSDIKCKAHEATAFIADGYNNTLGLIYREPGKQLPSVAELNEKDANGRGKIKIIPRIKFVIPTHKPRNGSPLGTSHLRSVYTPWWKKQMWNPQHLAYVTRFAQPSMYANLPKDAVDIPIKDGEGNITGYRSIIEATNTALAQMKGGAVATVIDTLIEMLEASGEGKAIFDSYAHEDRQIAKGVLMQTLTTEEGQYMARAASAIHQDVFGLLISFLRAIMETVWHNEVLKPLVRYNFGQEAADHLVPRVSLGDTEVQDIPKLMGAIAQMCLAGVIHWSQYAAICVMLGIPPGDEKEMEKDRKAMEEQRVALADAAKVKAVQGIGAPGAPGEKPAAGAPKPGAPKPKASGAAPAKPARPAPARTRPTRPARPTRKAA